MFSGEQKEILAKAVSTYGVESQMLKLVEEMSELTTAIMKRILLGNGEGNIPEEFADVCVVMEQLKDIISSEKENQEWINYKIERLKNTMKRREP